MKWKILLTLVAALAIMASGAYADTLVGAGGGWQTYVPPDQNNTPYWDGNSSDNDSTPQTKLQPATIGNFLTKTDWFAATGGGAAYNTYSPGLTTPNWWGNGNAAVANMYFTPVPLDSGSKVKILVEVAGYASTNTFGWYLQADVAGGITAAERHELFPGSAGPGTGAVEFIPGGDYGFYIGVGDKYTTGPKAGTQPIYYYMDSLYNSSGDTTAQHFAVFRPLANDIYSNSFFIGAEDLPWCNSDKDFQDMVVKITPSSGSGLVPLPPSALLLGSGLLGLLILRRSKR